MIRTLVVKQPNDAGGWIGRVRSERRRIPVRSARVVEYVRRCDLDASVRLRDRSEKLAHAGGQRGIANFRFSQRAQRDLAGQRSTAWRAHVRFERVAESAIRVPVGAERGRHRPGRAVKKRAGENRALQETRVAPHEIGGTLER